MKVKTLQIENIGGFREASLDFSNHSGISNHIILIGNNGSGKTTILESIAKSLTWFVARVKSDKGNGSPIDELMIHNDANSGQIRLEIVDHDQENSWNISKAKKARRNDHHTNFEGLNKLTDIYVSKYSEDQLTSFPLLTYYDAHRGVLDIPTRIRTRHKFEQLNGYDNSLKGIVDYRTFFEWFREKEDLENSSKIQKINQLEKRFDNITELNKLLESENDIQLNAVRDALCKFLPEFSHFRVERRPKLHFAVNKNDKTLNLEQLSQGEKLMIALVGDISRRLAILNPSLPNPNDGFGIVLIDEAELHLHPKWQRNLLKNLSTTFPNCQFIFSTHSPLIISDMENTKSFVLNNGSIQALNEVYGLDVNQVLAEVMDTTERNIEIQQLVEDFREAITFGKLIDARELYAQLKSKLNENHIELLKSRVLLKKLELAHEKNNQGS